jgi:hypothetical protein
MSRFHVGGKVVERVDLLRKRHLAWRLDMWPFAIIYILWLTTIVPSIDIGDATIVLGGLVALHILVWLFTAWSVDFKCFVQYSKVCNIVHFFTKNHVYNECYTHIHTCIFIKSMCLFMFVFVCVCIKHLGTQGSELKLNDTFLNVYNGNKKLFFQRNVPVS